MTNKRVVQTFLATSALFLAMSGMSARAQDAAAPAAAAPAPSAAAPMRHHGDGFKKLDTNGNGMVSRDEAKGHRWLEEHFDEIDTNHDGQISKNELAAWHKAHAGEMQARLDAKFKAADKNGDGALTREEMQAGLPKLAKHFDEIDANHDGKVTEDEIRAFMKARHEARRAQRDTPAAPGGPSATKGQ
ncbi:EF-hand domain-containing protein [Ralstonia solanacearum]|uniref:EF-hand domain-containing protein n=1 Tax=Ralstonia solanacearum TaxID=305 RepID=UPI000451EAF5|nr:EF-hand domain-containing protein [Ralstonia solanacearum]EUJ16208.1 calcium sensor EFh [Ralstonia solanacearum P673]MCL9846129.1 EF-hand domain-containing protein [Ralstonia solanacearum]MCL9851147.1 EF-hand domain-containing protein [Ralstonia solanacearum]MCL9854278.1 EF-hand domain-containing protein [Ralstonia solanacearum]MCL9860316.1 EF-hand domain-containing protein [Ralstonia solanacearum]